jgi:hypothetical protein
MRGESPQEEKVVEHRLRWRCADNHTKDHCDPVIATAVKQMNATGTTGSIRACLAGDAWQSGCINTTPAKAIGDLAARGNYHDQGDERGFILPNLQSQFFPESAQRRTTSRCLNLLMARGAQRCLGL